MMISGLGVFYPDKADSTRRDYSGRRGRPTIAGIRAGRDEVLKSLRRFSDRKRRQIKSRRWPGRSDG
jgi:hypothetical protein